MADAPWKAEALALYLEDSALTVKELAEKTGASLRVLKKFLKSYKEDPDGAEFQRFLPQSQRKQKAEHASNNIPGQDKAINSMLQNVLNFARGAKSDGDIFGLGNGIGTGGNPALMQMVSTMMSHRYGATPGDTNKQLLLAAELGDTKTVNDLLGEVEVDVNYRDKTGYSSLSIASRRRHAATVMRLLEAPGVLVDSHWNGNSAHTPLMEWVEETTAEARTIVMRLLELGANVNALDEHGTGPLYFACQAGNLEMVKLLLCEGADPGISESMKPCDGSGPFLIAAQLGHTKIVEELFRAGADMNIRLKGTKIKSGSSALCLAAQNGHEATVQALIETCGCCVNYCNSENRTPLFIAVAKKHWKVVSHLVRAGAALSALVVDDETGVNTIEHFGHHMCERLTRAYDDDQKDVQRAFLELAQSLYIMMEMQDEMSAMDFYKVLMKGAVEKCMKPASKATKQGQKSSVKTQNHGLPLDNYGLPGDIPVYVDPMPHAWSGEKRSLENAIKDLPQEDCTSMRAAAEAAIADKNPALALVLFEHAIKLTETPCDRFSARLGAGSAANSLSRFERALKHARKAIEHDMSETNARKTFVRALAGLGRAAEAFCWIADNLSTESPATKADLCAIAAGNSRYCFGLTEGVYIDKHPSGSGYCVKTCVKLSAHQAISKEVAVVDWACEWVQDENLLRKNIGSVTPDKIRLLSGIFPRSEAEIESSGVMTTVDSLSKLEGRASKALHPSQKGNLKEVVRGLAAAKLCAHDDGLHHFGAFYNHSCRPNCEVRGDVNLTIYANRDIEPGEELFISYIGASTLESQCQLTMPVRCRQLSIRKGWGADCYCERCAEEIAELQSAGAPEAGEVEWIKFQQAILPILNDPKWNLKFMDCPQLAQQKNAADWRSVEWKEMYLMHEFAMSVNHGILLPLFRKHGISDGHSQSMAGKNSEARIVAEAKIAWTKLMEVDAWKRVNRWVELRLTHMSVTAAAMSCYHEILLRLVETCLVAKAIDKLAPEQRVHELDSEAKLKEKRHELRDHLKYTPVDVKSICMKV